MRSRSPQRLSGGERCATATFTFPYLQVKVEVYSPIPRASTALQTLHNYPLIRGPCSFISYLISPGGHTACQSHVLAHRTDHTRTLLDPARYPLTPGSKECTCGHWDPQPLTKCKSCRLCAVYHRATAPMHGAPCMIGAPHLSYT